MTDATVTALHPAAKPDRTNAERQRRYKQKRKQQRLAAVTEPVTKRVETRGNGVIASTMVAALALATVSAGFSITGMTAVFVGATLPVIGMGVTFRHPDVPQRHRI
jgi:hypothetical protein